MNKKCSIIISRFLASAYEQVRLHSAYRKRCFTLMLLFLCTNLTHAQIAKWRLYPSYDTMFIPNGTNLIITSDSSRYKNTLWNFDCDFICRIDGVLHDFSNGVAVNTDPINNHVKGFVSESGKYVSLSDGKYYVDLSYPYFSDGYLVVQGRSKYYRYIDNEGNISTIWYNKAYPFFNGYTSCEYNNNQENMRDPVRCLMDKHMKKVPFSIHSNTIKISNIDFVSSVNDEHVAVVIVKKKLYLFLSGNNELKPLCSKENDVNLKEQAKLPDDLSECMVKADNTWHLKTKCGKNDSVIIHFDEYMRPISIQYTDTVRVYKKHIEKPIPFNSSLQPNKENGIYGIAYNNKEILAPQFEEIQTCFGDKAIVRKKGKYGVMQLYKEGNPFSVSIHNKGELVPFIHKNFKTTIRVVVPSTISADSVSINIVDIDTSLRCTIDSTSWSPHNTPYGNYIQYDCTLGIPDILFERDTAIVEYPIQIIYNGFVSPKINVKVKEWFCKNLSVILDKDSRTLNNDGGFSFEFSLDYAIPNEKDVIYPVEVTLFPESKCALEIKSLKKYKVTVTSLKEGVNQVDIQVAEEGCPATTWPVLINYTPKVEPTNKRSEGTEANVTIEVKESKRSVREPHKGPKENQPIIEI